MWHRLALEFGERDVEEFKESLTSTQFIDWVAFLEMEEERRNKWDRYLAALRFDVNNLIHVVRKVFGGSGLAPEINKMFMDAEALAAENKEPFVPPKWENGVPVKAENAKGVETTDPSTITDKWKAVAATAKSRWGMILKGAEVERRPGVLDKGTKHGDNPPGT